jgi:tripartite-type tricarboxylate transporter receptor subunit TctC
MDAERSPYMKDAPTFREQGVDLVAGATRGIAAPKGVPADIVAKLVEAVDKALNDPEYLEAAKKAEIPLNFLKANEYKALLDKMTADLEATWKVTPWR